jgi:hypothetical protein
MGKLFFLTLGFLLFVSSQLFSMHETRFDKVLKWYYSHESSVPTKNDLLGFKSGQGYDYQNPNETIFKTLYCADMYDEFFDEHWFSCYKGKTGHSIVENPGLYKIEGLIEMAIDKIKEYNIRVDLNRPEICIDKLPFNKGVQCYRKYRNKLLYIVKDETSWYSPNFEKAKIIRVGGFDKSY